MWGDLLNEVIDIYPPIPCKRCLNCGWSWKGKKEETKIDKDIVRDCHKCVYQVGCHGNPVGCKRYKRDAPLSCKESFVYPGDRTFCLKKDRELLDLFECEDCEYKERPTSD